MSKCPRAGTCPPSWKPGIYTLNALADQRNWDIRRPRPFSNRSREFGVLSWHDEFRRPGFFVSQADHEDIFVHVILWYTAFVNPAVLRSPGAIAPFGAYRARARNLKIISSFLWHFIKFYDNFMTKSGIFMMKFMIHSHRIQNILATNSLLLWKIIEE